MFTASKGTRETKMFMNNEDIMDEFKILATIWA
jgi:hypothetical protein